MTDSRKALGSKWKQADRYRNFGPALRAVTVHGFRGIRDTTISFDYPITAITGLNGAGKSSIGQLVLCGYRKPSTATNYSRYYVRDFFPVSVVDPKPIADDAKVVFRYETDQPTQPQDVTISRVQSEWSGYKRQPERKYFYVGFTIYIPKVERRDLSVYRANGLTLGGKREIPLQVRRSFAAIVGSAYDDLSFQGVQNKAQLGEVGIAARFGNAYSENNMGFGEGRVLYTVDLLESSPEQCLFVLEEPETSLHENAQHEFTKYLIDVANRRGHQIVLTTHSSAILQALPSQASMLLVRDRDGVSCYPGLSASRVRSVLSGGRTAALDIVVEDDFAKIILREAIRQIDRSFLQSVSIHPIGSAEDVRDGIKLLRLLDKRCAGVRDGDKPAVPADQLFKLPGTKAPEKEVFEHASVQAALMERFGVEILDVFAQNPDADHHDWPEILSNAASVDTNHLASVAADEYVRAIGTVEFGQLVDNLKRCCI